MIKTELMTQLDNYYNKMYTNLMMTHSKKAANEIIKMSQNSAEDYFEQNPSASFEDFLEEFGEPEVFAEDILIRQKEIDNISQSIRFSKAIKRGVAITVLIALLVGGYFSYSIYKANKLYDNSMLDHKIIEIY